MHLEAALRTAQTQNTTEWHVLLRVRQTLARLWARQDPAQARQHWQLLAHTYWALGATDWIARFFPDWHAVDPTAPEGSWLRDSGSDAQSDAK
ncbi:MAG: hypothetical protein C7B46_17605 [Sulfobacillus benefaciens]|uniref:Bacterial transcriptional activator domain-containing protein n=1 Tax=Sulfobacillus benefaciens TaxID=453960 RepID=A0A2T2X897_9FIRM|nr:MAG: hypothetical protein C7B46_17605 [Sulfobacillus benefaciens]